MIKLCELYNEIKNSQYKIYCDMDGVIVNFEKGYQELTGETTDEADKKGKEYFWQPLTAPGSEFWSNLEWMPEGKKLWNYIKKYNPPLLSAPSREKSSRIGKQQWVDKHLPSVELIMVPAWEKKEFANPQSILIDDRKTNIEEWKQSGGIGILYVSTDQVIKELKNLGL